MYESFFQLAERPFLSAPAAGRYYPARTVEAARQTLTRTVERAEGPGLIIGSAGTGKSLLCHVLEQQFRPQMEVAHLSSARLCTRRALLQSLLYGLGLPYRQREEGELRLTLIDHLQAATHGLLLLVDEAHLLPLRLLEEIRLLTNFVHSGRPCVRLVLAGSPALEERFASPKLESFNQRIAARCYLEAMDERDTVGYVRAELTKAGGDPEEVFEPEAIVAVYRATDGVPRLINQVCDHALVLACAAEVQPIDVAMVEEAWADLQQLPLPWSPASGDQHAAVIEFGSLADPDQPARGQDEAEATPSIPFPRAEADDSREDEVLDDAADESGEPDASEFQPWTASAPEVELVFPDLRNPFAEPFEEEEIVIDRYAMQDDQMLRQRPKVTSRDSDRLAELVHPPQEVDPRENIGVAHQETHEEAAVGDEDEVDGVGDLPAAFLEGETEQDDHEIVAWDNEPAATHDPQQVVATLDKISELAEGDGDMITVQDDVPAPQVVRSVPRQQYTQLFAKLRRG